MDKVTVFLLGLLLGIATNFAPFKSYDYQRDMAVIEVDGPNVILQDVNDQIWETIADDYKVNDTIVAYLDNSGTIDTSYDDVIVDTKLLKAED